MDLEAKVDLTPVNGVAVLTDIDVDKGDLEFGVSHEVLLLLVAKEKT
jgi:hypothetical protein